MHMFVNNMADPDAEAAADDILPVQIEPRISIENGISSKLIWFLSNKDNDVCRTIARFINWNFFLRTNNMVVFTCGQCNESLKKSQVEKHYQSRCRNCNVLACVDCGQDFFGDSYKEHIKCISEEEKYSGKNYKPKPNANKGEVKQEQWLQKVQTAIDQCITNPRLKNILERLKDYPNIPRKKAKFENFVSNSMNVRDKRLVGEVWDILLANTDQPAPDTQTTDASTTTNGHKAEENLNKNVTNKDQLKEMSKEDRKAERKRVKNKAKNKDETGDNDSKTEKTDLCEETSDKSNKKKAKKRKRKNMEDEDDDTTVTKKQHTDETDQDKTLNATTEDNDENNVVSIGMKFNWEDTITAVLSSKGETSIKKLKKKVLAEYYTQGCKPKGEERLIAKLYRKISKNPNFIVKKERIKLKCSK